MQNEECRNPGPVTAHPGASARRRPAGLGACFLMCREVVWHPSGMQMDRRWLTGGRSSMQPWNDSPATIWQPCRVGPATGLHQALLRTASRLGSQRPRWQKGARRSNTQVHCHPLRAGTARGPGAWGSPGGHADCHKYLCHKYLCQNSFEMSPC